MSRPANNSWGLGLFWGLLTVLIIIAASIALVRFRNRDRGETQAVMWALEDMEAVPKVLSAALFAPQRYDLALKRFRMAIEEHELPVDSIRAFYQEYALHARDGELDAGDLRALGPFFGLTAIPDTADSDPLLTVPVVDTSSVVPADTGSGTQ
ncbi:MAG: hypothetical protein Kow0074_11180 [Candidatus Zixiibacteriota bacterium]